MKKNEFKPNVSCETFKELLFSVFEKTDLEISVAQAEKMYLFWELLLKWNSVHNLTSVTDSRKAVISHFADSLLPLLIKNDLFSLNGKKILDYGTGGGFPGIPLSIMLPDSNFYLLDKAHKKISFLLFAASELDLHNVFPVCNDIKFIDEIYDIVLSRAVSIDSRNFLLIKKLLSLGGFFVSFLSKHQFSDFDEHLFYEHYYSFLSLDRKLTLYRF